MAAKTFHLSCQLRTTEVPAVLDFLADREVGMLELHPIRPPSTNGRGASAPEPKLLARPAKMAKTDKRSKGRQGVRSVVLAALGKRPMRAIEMRPAVVAAGYKAASLGAALTELRNDGHIKHKPGGGRGKLTTWMLSSDSEVA